MCRRDDGNDEGVTNKLAKNSARFGKNLEGGKINATEFEAIEIRRQQLAEWCREGPCNKVSVSMRGRLQAAIWNLRGDRAVIICVLPSAC